MDRITMGFGPISDVTGFSHKGGMTFLEIQEVLRRKINELVAAHASLKSHVDTRNADVISAFNRALASFTTEFNTAIDTYAALTQEFGGLVVEFNSVMDQLNATQTMTDEEIVTALGG